ncbi:hypothetical protein ACIOKD_37750 [Streptomyces sp. NPDC087844]|uniref:hypothetical protein n=1 Tax=Streptomyces sp. NPDC087844 TaxID=3365805 RepID=UPI00380286AF
MREPSGGLQCAARWAGWNVRHTGRPKYAAAGRAEIREPPGWLERAAGADPGVPWCACTQKRLERLSD